jgi:hypothetical protein
MKKFKFKFITKLSNGQEYENGQKIIPAENYDSAVKKLHSKDTPFCTVITVEIIK